MAAYYNENDPFAAAWLTELIAAGLIAPGEVDERSIEDVLPTELTGFTQCHFFAGIGVWSYALRQAGWPDDRRVWTGSCPCQPFSAAGKGARFTDERHLWPAWFHLIEQCRPRTVFGEQVASKDGYAWLDLVQADMEGLEYAVGPVVLPAAGFGAPHGRHRIFFVADSRNSECRWGSEPERCQQRRILHAPDGSEISNVVHARSQRQQGSEQRPTRNGDGQRTQTHGPTREPSEAFSAVANADERGWRICGAATSNGDEAREPHSVISGADGSVAHTTDIRRSEYEREPGERGIATPDDASERCGFSSVEIAISAEPQRGVNGFWRDAEWLYCKDGKYRPVEPGTFPLAHGATARVGRLRGYGNAINAQVAQAFIEAYLEG